MNIVLSVEILSKKCC